MFNQVVNFKNIVGKHHTYYNKIIILFWPCLLQNLHPLHLVFLAFYLICIF